MWSDPMSFDSYLAKRANREGNHSEEEQNFKTPRFNCMIFANQESTH